ncbi:hypothetical protein [Amylibacter sp. IMCC11727]|uniref:hypothetical protein n=1 Tax=Amylibacter sp. IMCC11727 TaxID=3039851 RepID=UPI00244DE67A|nr:hypothetical protein [Amylibacter sp. IMCC11727]WGI22170.1 hypothetical protein QBD29_01760 [Amylibacter sp. IMCC11727]
MKNLFAISAFVTAGFLYQTASVAEGHSTTEIVMPAGLCPETHAALAKWAIGKPVFSAYAVPTVVGAGCGSDGPVATAGIAMGAASIDAAHVVALRVCNENRGDLGKCAVIGTVRPKGFAFTD